MIGMIGHRDHGRVQPCKDTTGTRRNWYNRAASLIHAQPQACRKTTGAVFTSDYEFA
jgi:hypothetical protein